MAAGTALHCTLRFFACAHEGNEGGSDAGKYRPLATSAQSDRSLACMALANKTLSTSFNHMTIDKKKCPIDCKV
jgi:hypothetical protein